MKKVATGYRGRGRPVGSRGKPREYPPEETWRRSTRIKERISGTGASEQSMAPVGVEALSDQAPQPPASPNVVSTRSAAHDPTQMPVAGRCASLMPPRIARLPSLVEFVDAEMSLEMEWAPHGAGILWMQAVKDRHLAEIEKTKRIVWCKVCRDQARLRCCPGAEYCSIDCQRADWDGGHCNRCLRFNLYTA